MTREETLKALAEPFDPALHKTLNKSGQSLTYVPVSEYIARLNTVLGADRWSEDTEVWRDTLNPEWELAKTTLEITILGEKSSKTGFGGQKIKVASKSGDIVDLGDELKGAASDSFKKACSKYGIGLELARSEEALNAQWLRDNPPADPEVLEKVKKAIDSLDDEGKDGLRKWWKDERLQAPDKLPLSQAERVLARIATLKPTK